MTGSEVRIGIVGAGTWGETHARIYQAHPASKVVAVCDSNAGRASGLASRLGIDSWYDDYEEMFTKEGLDSVAIVTPDFAHAEIAIAAARHGLHMLIEKPLATTRDDVFRMIDAITAGEVRAMVDLHNRFSPPFNVARQSVADGELGELQTGYMRLNDAKWVATDLLPWAAQSSILWFLGSHSVDTLRWFFDDEVTRVYSVSRSGLLKGLGVDTVDSYLTTLEFAGGGIAHMENGWINPNAMPNINDIKFTVVGDKGMISIDASSHNLIQKYTEEKVTVPDVLVRDHVFGYPAGFAYQSIRSFVDSLVSGEDFRVSLPDSAKVSLIVLAIMESAKKRQPVEVDYGVITTG
ncbi:Gfo/Idh/MocA family protein [Compostimonas suwonensis]|uniref:Putative dehydrogenase n=1 Tax=Compostimonas suwonensis TaxID=1048394 RepID=A0A2M9C0I5_9MICO|nr:Gfo/Idh/MocA family oxidoreductase [Compostimonas suwonensis]PJJ63834.1 putative dehydrogenase [Compostimonas suwonensis]